MAHSKARRPASSGCRGGKVEPRLKGTAARYTNASENLPFAISKSPWAALLAGVPLIPALLIFSSKFLKKEEGKKRGEEGRREGREGKINEWVRRVKRRYVVNTDHRDMTHFELPEPRPSTRSRLRVTVPQSDIIQAHSTSEAETIPF